METCPLCGDEIHAENRPEHYAHHCPALDDARDDPYYRRLRDDASRSGGDQL